MVVAMNEHNKLKCGCIWKWVRCRCDFEPHEHGHRVIVSSCRVHQALRGLLVPKELQEQEAGNEGNEIEK